MDEVKLEFEDRGTAQPIAEKAACEKDTGARALRAIIEEFMLDIMYEIPKDDNIGEVTITRAYIRRYRRTGYSVERPGSTEIRWIK